MQEHDYFAVLAQYPSTDGSIHDLRPTSNRRTRKQAAFIVAADLLALTLLVPPGEFGADIVVGNTQRFGVPMGGGGPHAAYLACRDEFKRSMPGRLVGVSVDTHGAAGLPAGAADARTAHPPREGHQQHLHGAGAAGGDGQHVRGLPRPAGPEAHRAARGQLHRGAGPGPARWACKVLTQHRLRHADHRHRRRDRRHPAAGAGRRRQPAPLRPRTWAWRWTRPPRATTSGALWAGSPSPGQALPDVAAFDRASNR
jgi:hypothetical protein